MGKGMWGGIAAFIVMLLILCTLYFENSIEEAENVHTGEPPSLSMQTFELKPVEEMPFKVTVEEISVDTSSEVGEECHWVCGEVVIDEDISAGDFYIVLEYSNVKNTPHAAVCYTPDFAEGYTAFSINENMSGEIIFKPQSFKKGVWYLLLYGSESLGTYTAYGILGSEYESMKNPVILKPRDLDAPGALLPDE